MKLAVLFDEKDWVKNFGARWDANESCWWMPYDMLINHPAGGEDVVYGELNRRQMIVGNYGNVDENVAKDWMHDATLNRKSAIDGYHLRNEKAGSVTFQHWTEIDVLRVEDHTPNGDDLKFLSPDQGRELWCNLVSCGYNRVNNTEQAV